MGRSTPLSSLSPTRKENEAGPTPQVQSLRERTVANRSRRLAPREPIGAQRRPVTRPRMNLVKGSSDTGREREEGEGEGGERDDERTMRGKKQLQHICVTVIAGSL